MACRPICPHCGGGVPISTMPRLDGTEVWHYIMVGPIGPENMHATLFRTKNGKHTLDVGFWSGHLGALMGEVKRRSESEAWSRNDSPERQEAWVSDYRALKDLGKAVVARWSDGAVLSVIHE